MDADPDLDSILAKLEEKGAEQSCPVCNADAPFEMNLPAGANAFLTVYSPDDARGLRVLPLICGNCGYVRLHSPAHLLTDGPVSWRPTE